MRLLCAADVLPRRPPALTGGPATTEDTLTSYVSYKVSTKVRGRTDTDRLPAPSSSLTAATRLPHARRQRGRRFSSASSTCAVGTMTFSGCATHLRRPIRRASCRCAAAVRRAGGVVCSCLAAWPGLRTVQPLPEKHAMKRLEHFSNDFLDRRRQGLEQFLMRCAAHPTLTKSELLLTFLEATNWELATQRKSESHFGSTMKRFFGQLRSASLKPESDPFKEFGDFLNKFGSYIADLDKTSNKWCDRDKAVVATINELAPAFKQLSASEPELQAALVQFSGALEKVRDATALLANVRQDDFIDTVHEYSLYVGVIKVGVPQARRSATLTARLCTGMRA